MAIGTTRMILENLSKSMEELKQDTKEQGKRIEELTIAQAAQTVANKDISNKLDNLSDTVTGFIENRSKSCPYNGPEVQAHKANVMKIIAIVVSILAFAVSAVTLLIKVL